MPEVKDLGLANNEIVSVTRTSGTGLPGSIDTYTITVRDGTVFTFNVTNGNNGLSGLSRQAFTSVAAFNTFAIANQDKIAVVMYHYIELEQDQYTNCQFLIGYDEEHDPYIKVRAYSSGSWYDITTLSSDEELVVYYFENAAGVSVVPTSRTIAGLSLESDISAEMLKTALKAISNNTTGDGYNYGPEDANDCENNTVYWILSRTTNYPYTGVTGVLYSIGAQGASGYTTQLFISRFGDLYARGCYSGNWTAWIKMAKNSEIPIIDNCLKYQSGDMQNGDANNAELQKFYWMVGNPSSNFPGGSSGIGCLMNFGYSDTYRVQLYFKKPYLGEVYFRICVNSSWSSWSKLLDSTTELPKLLKSKTPESSGIYGPTDANSAENNTISFINGVYTHYPYPSADDEWKNRGILLTSGYDSNFGCQLLSTRYGEVWARGVFNGTWTSWKKCYNSNDDIKNNLFSMDGINVFSPQVADFASIGACGDSFTAGYMYDKDNVLRPSNYKYAWPTIFGRKNGMDVGIYAVAGRTAIDWLTDSRCLAAMQADTAKELYVVALGINDSLETFGTPNDIDLSNLLNSANTSCGCFGKIKYYLQQKGGDNVKIVFCTIPYDNETNRTKNALIKACAEKLGVACAETAYMIQESPYWYQSHPTKIGQTVLCDVIQKAIEKAMVTYGSYFNSFTYEE